LFDMIAFDADDTLWHNESLYTTAQARFRQILAPYCCAERADQKLYETEIRNLVCYGYGIKAFALSMIEASIELSNGRITSQEIQQLLDLAKGMLAADVQLVEHAQSTVCRLSASYPLMIITKGDLRDQEAKVERSGLRPYFRYIEIVADKTREAYAAILARHNLAPERFLMVGNSLRSDILPVVALGGRAVHIPYHTTWAHEHVIPSEAERQGYIELEHLGLLPELVEELAAGRLSWLA